MIFCSVVQCSIIIHFFYNLKMPTCCVVLNCKSRESTDSDFHFFTFPINDGIRLEKWMLALNCQGFIPKVKLNIPGGSYKLKLKPNTVPSVFPGRPVASTSISSESPVHQSDVLITTPTRKRPLLLSSDDDNKDKSWVWSWAETKMPKATSSPVLITPSKKMRSEISFLVSPKNPISTPTKYKKQIRLLKQKLRIQEAKIKNMKGLLDNLKNIAGMLNDDSEDMLLARAAKGRRYSPEIKQFALTLHYYSPKAYDYCRSILINAEPGFHTEVFDALKTLSPADKHCNLILDVMAIKKQIVWDKKN
ncbi:THAP domain-containing protein 4-like, partial [Aphis craccivora]